MNDYRSALHKPAFRRTCIAASLLAAILLSSCSASDSPSVTSPSSHPSASPSASASPSPSEPPAAAMLKKTEHAAQGLNKYAFRIQLRQKLTGGGKDSNSTASVDMKGRAELNPLKLDQTVTSNTDGETYTMRAILVPGAYYMYDFDFEEWSKSPKQQSADLIKTLSDFQVNPAKAIGAVQSLGQGLKDGRHGETIKITYEGNGPEAKAFLENVLESTLGLSDMDKKVRESIKIDSLKLEFTIDPANYWPLSYKIDSVMTVEYEAGKRSTLAQTLSGTFSEHNASKAVIVPEAAKKAPEPDAPAIGDPQTTSAIV